MTIRIAGAAGYWYVLGMTNLRHVYSDIHPRYETVNRIISLGMDRPWRRRMVRSALGAVPGKWLDMCTGTGETAVLLHEAASDRTRIFAADFSMEMLREFRSKPGSVDIPAVLADATAIPFASGAFQLVTTSFATRNLHRNRQQLIRAFAEIHRILSPGGLYVSIETSRPDCRLIDAIYRLIVHCVVEPAGTRLGGCRTGYTYLSRSIRTFFHADELAGILREAGFDSVQFESLFFGAAAIHLAQV